MKSVIRPTLRPTIRPTLSPSLLHSLSGHRWGRSADEQRQESLSRPQAGAGGSDVAGADKAATKSAYESVAVAPGKRNRRIEGQATGGEEAERVRAAGGPEDTAAYTCSCGLFFTAPVSTTVTCPHCGAGQAW